MNTKLRTIFAAPSGSWGGLFTQEEREQESVKKLFSHRTSQKKHRKKFFIW